MSFFVTKKEKDDEDAGEDAATGSSSTSSSSAREAGSSWFSVDMSSMQGALQAGGWRSPAFLIYMEKVELEADAVLEAHSEDSEDELDEFGF